MLDKIRVLDETNISFKAYDGILEVYDQSDNLVGETALPIPIDENMDIENIYAIAADYGYNIGEMITGILSDAVMVEKIYDVWLTEENMIFYSPSAGQFIAEPYIGLFGALGTYFQSEEELEEELEEYKNEEETDEEDDQEEVSYFNREDTVEDDSEEDTEEDGQTDFVEGDFQELDENEIEEETTYETLEEETTEHNEEVSYETNDNTIVEVEEVHKEEPIVEEGTVEPEPVVIVQNVNEKHKEQLKQWKDAYLVTVTDKREQNGVTLSNLRDKVLGIVLENKQSVFEASESEILFKLLDSSTHVFEAKTALQSGLYLAYLIEKDGL